MKHRPRPSLPAPFPSATVYVTTSRPRADWCPACKAYTAFVGDVLLLAEDGVSVVGTYTGCEICDDPDTSGGSRG